MRSIKIKNARTIFVDYYDTLVFRNVTADELIFRWATCIHRRFPELPSEIVQNLPRLRTEAFSMHREEASHAGKGETEVTYEKALGSVYKQIAQHLAGTDEATFVACAKELDFDLECGCQRANRKLISALLVEKMNGKKIYCISDFYLNAKYLKQLMIAANVPTYLFDDVFVSCDIGRRKAVGDLYAYVLQYLGLNPYDVVMIGDNKISDCDKAAEHGLSTVLQRHVCRKAFTHLYRIIGIDNAARQMKVSMNETFRHGQPYGEYICIFYIFTKRLFHILKQDNVQAIAFMAREGFYLKKLFELYEEICVPNSEKIDTSYFWCSRRSVMAGIREALLPEFINEKMSLRSWLKSLNLTVEDVRPFILFDEPLADVVCNLAENEMYRQLIDNPEFRKIVDEIIRKNEMAFRKYMGSFIRDGIFRFVDSGWKCTTQNAIQQYYGIKTKGYYIGVQIPDEPILKLDKEGIIFSEIEPKSKYYDYLGTNIPFYQQLLAAPHGTALRYVLTKGDITILHEWDSMEEKLYNRYIETLQKYMLLKFRGLCAWDSSAAWDKTQDWYIARLSMRSSLFADKARQKFIRVCTDNYVQNFRQESRGRVKYDPKKVRISIDLIWKPEKYLRYVSKVQRTSVYEHRIVRILYPLISTVYYGYTLAIHFIKH